MMMACINALLYPKYSSSNLIHTRNLTNVIIERKYKVTCEEKQTKFTDMEKVPPKNKNMIKQIRTNELNGKSSNNTLKEHTAIENNNTSIENSTRNNSILCSLWKYKQIEHRNKIYINILATKYKYGSKYITEKSVYNTIPRIINHNNDVTISLIYNDCIINNKRNGCINMNIKHLKIFISTNNINNMYINRIGLYLYIHLNKQSKIKYNLNKNLHVNDIYRVYNINQYNWNHMPSFEEVTELYIRFPIDLNNSIDIKILDLTFNDNGWHRLEQLLNILCNTANGNLNDFNIVWWNMQTCWTLFNKNPEAKKKINEFTINCKAIMDDDEEEIMIVYTIIDGKNVPINTDTRSIQEIIESIAAI
jgi:hypothetical protein